MANYKQHAGTGALVGLIAGVVINAINQADRKNNNPDYKFDWCEAGLYALGGSAVGAAAGVLPDLLEPATDPNHRKVFHSWAAGIALAYGIYKANKSDLKKETKAAINVAGAGYFSHLLLDVGTPKRLPII